MRNKAIGTYLPRETPIIGKKKVLVINLLYWLIRMVCLKAIMRLFDLITLRDPSPLRVLVTLFMNGLVVLIFQPRQFGSSKLLQKLAFSLERPPKEKFPRRTYFKEVLVGQACPVCLQEKESELPPPPPPPVHCRWVFSLWHLALSLVAWRRRMKKNWV